MPSRGRSGIGRGRNRGLRSSSICCLTRLNELESSCGWLLGGRGGGGEEWHPKRPEPTAGVGRPGGKRRVWPRDGAPSVVPAVDTTPGCVTNALWRCGAVIGSGRGTRPGVPVVQAARPSSWTRVNGVGPPHAGGADPAVPGPSIDRERARARRVGLSLARPHWDRPGKPSAFDHARARCSVAPGWSGARPGDPCQSGRSALRYRPDTVQSLAPRRCASSRVRCAASISPRAASRAACAR